MIQALRERIKDRYKFMTENTLTTVLPDLLGDFFSFGGILDSVFGKGVFNKDFKQRRTYEIEYSGPMGKAAYTTPGPISYRLAYRFVKVGPASGFVLELILAIPTIIGALIHTFIEYFGASKADPRDFPFPSPNQGNAPVMYALGFFFQLARFLFMAIWSVPVALYIELSQGIANTIHWVKSGAKWEPTLKVSVDMLEELVTSIEIDYSGGEFGHWDNFGALKKDLEVQDGLNDRLVLVIRVYGGDLLAKFTSSEPTFPSITDALEQLEKDLALLVKSKVIDTRNLGKEFAKPELVTIDHQCFDLLSQKAVPDYAYIPSITI